MPINKAILLISTFIIQIGIFSQETTWVNTYGGKNTDDSFDCTAGNDGHLYFCGVTNFNPTIISPYINTAEDVFFIAKCNSEGNIIWEITDVSSEDGYSKATAVTTDSLGNVYFGGFTTKDIELEGKTYTKYSDEHSDSFIGKADKNGNIIWFFMLSGPNLDTFEKITTTNDGIIFSLRFNNTINIDGHTIKSDYPNIPNSYSNSFVAKMSFDGKLQWLTKLNGKSAFIRNVQNGSTNDIFFSCEASAEGITSPFITRMNSTDITPIGNPLGSSDTYLCRLNGIDGSVIWVNRIGGNANDLSYAITLDSDDNIYGSILFQSELQFTSQSSGLHKLQLIGSKYDIGYYKYTKDGNYVWAKAIGGSASEGVYDMAACSDGNIYIVGYILDPGLTIGDNTYEVKEDGTESFIFSCNHNGDIKWSQATDINYESGGVIKSLTRIWGIAITNNNNLFTVGGYSGEGEFFAYKTMPPSNDSKNAFYSLIVPKDITNIPTKDEINYSSAWYSNNYLHFNIANNTKICIFETSGKLISCYEYFGKPIDINTLPTGIYIAKYFNNKQYKSIRFIKY